MKRTYYAVTHPNHAIPNAAAPFIYTRESRARASIARVKKAPVPPKECDKFVIVPFEIEIPGGDARTPRADGFKVLKASESLRSLAGSKRVDSLMDAADLSAADLGEGGMDLLSEGIRIGLMMAATGQHTAVEVPVGDGCALFVGKPRDVRRKIAALPDDEEDGAK